MADGNFQSYWSGTASYDSIVPLINMDFDGLKTAIIEMVSGASVEVDVGSFQNDVENIVNKDDVLTYLIHMGYLAYSSVNRMAFVPNEEIRQELIRATKRKAEISARIRGFTGCNFGYGWRNSCSSD